MYFFRKFKEKKAIRKLSGGSHRVLTIAIISAENPMGEKATPAYNEEATNKLLNTLSSGHVIYFPTKGRYGGAPENSVFIYNVSLDYVKSLADTFRQESMIFVDITAPDCISYQYWERPGEGKELRMVREEHDFVNAMNDDDNYTKLCRRFKFRIPFFEGYVRTLTALNEYARQDDVDRMLRETIGAKWSGHHQYVTHAKLYGKWNNGKCHIRENKLYELSDATNDIFNSRSFASVIAERVVKKIKRMVMEEKPKYECLNEARCWSEGMKLNAFPKIRRVNEKVILSEGIDFEPEPDKKGGIIVFSTDVNAVQLSPNTIANWIRQKLATVSNRMTATRKIDKIAKKHELVGWTIGHYLDGRYTAKSGKQFGENSLSVEIVGVDFDTLLHISEDLCRSFKQESLLLKDYSSGRVLFVNPN